MSEIKIRCVDQVLIVQNEPDIFSGDKNVDRVSFSFCSAWDGFEKMAVFYNDPKDPYHVLLDENNSALIPHEVMKDKATLYIGAIGVKEGAVRTSAVIRYKILKGAFTEDTYIADPTPALYEQLLSKFAELYSKVDLLEDLLARNVEYDNATSKLSATNAQDAIDEVAIARLGNCYFKHEDGKFYIGYESEEMEV